MIATLIKDSIIYKLESEIQAVAESAAPPLIMSSGVPRSGGLHLSTIIRSLYAHTFKGGGRDYTSVGGGTEYMALGFAWERVLERVIAEVFPSERILLHPGEVVSDGIAMSPDGIDTVDALLEEWKCTFKSAVKRPDTGDFPTWMAQIKAYCRALEFTKCRLRILHLRGSYFKPLEDGKVADGPIVRTWLLEFTQQELDDNWRNIVNHAKELGLL